MFSHQSPGGSPGEGDHSGHEYERINLPRTTTVERCGGLQCNDFRHGDVIPAANPCTKV